jgi:cephalosporin hydroxylase
VSDPVNPYDPAAARAMSDDAADVARSFFKRTYPHRYSYNFSWLGRPIIQYPQDIVALAEIVWSVRPELIVETGVAHGGSAVFFASMLELLGGKGLVAAIDIDIRAHNRAAIEAHPLASRIRLIEGSSIDPRVVREVEDMARGKRSVMVVLDSDHTHAHVSAELAAYAPLVTLGSYVVVMDTVVEFLGDAEQPNRPWGKGNNPWTAVQAFLASDSRFALDHAIEEKLLITAAPGGYLRRVKD